MELEGHYKLLEEIAAPASSISFENDEPQFYWPQRRYATSRSRHHLALLDDVYHVGIWNFYSEPARSFVRNMSYPGSLSHFKISHALRQDGPLETAHLSVRLGDVRVVEEPVFVIGGHNNHYHWLLNWLPRMDIYHRALAAGWNSEFLAECKFAVHSDISKAQLESLTLLGIDPSRILRVNVREPILFRKLALSSFFSNYIYDSRVLRFLNTKFQNPLPLDKGTRGRKFWIYREGLPEPKRRAANFEQLASILQKHDIEILKLEDMSLAEQIDCFSTADLVIAIHGAGLSNCVFCQPGTDIVLFEYKEISEYEELAKQCKLNVTTFRCEQAVDEVFEADRPGFDARFRDLIIPIEEVDQKLGWITRRRNVDADVLQINNLSALQRAAQKS